jgi:hypothetical protein
VKKWLLGFGVGILGLIVGISIFFCVVCYEPKGVYLQHEAPEFYNVLRARLEQ